MRGSRRVIPSCNRNFWLSLLTFDSYGGLRERKHSMAQGRQPDSGRGETEAPLEQPFPYPHPAQWSQPACSPCRQRNKQTNSLHGQGKGTHEEELKRRLCSLWTNQISFLWFCACFVFLPLRGHLLECWDTDTSWWSWAMAGPVLFL